MALALEIEKQLISASYSISKLQGLYRKIAIKNNIPHTYVQIFYILYFNDFVTQKQIHKLCETPKQTINNTIKELENSGHITLITNENDKRQKYIKFTDKGEKYCRCVLQPFFTINEKVIQRIGTDFAKELSENLNIFCRALEMEIEISDITQKWEEEK